MAPTFYAYSPVPMDSQWKEDRCSGRGLKWAGAAGVLVLIIGLIIALAIFIVRSNSDACQQGRQVEQECRNTSRLLQHELTRAQEELLKVGNQAATCNHTVVTLMASLEKQRTQNRKQEEQVQELQGEIRKLKQTLQDTSAELEQLRKENQDSSGTTTEPNSAGSLAPAIFLSQAALLLLHLLILDILWP